MWASRLPEYMESGECLFCHRNEVGVTWAKNKHNRTIRDADPKEPAIAALHADPKAKEVAEQVELIMGDTRSNRFLKRAAAYGKLDLLSVAAVLSRTGRRTAGSCRQSALGHRDFCPGVRRLPRHRRRSRDTRLCGAVTGLFYLPWRRAGRARQRRQIDATGQEAARLARGRHFDLHSATFASANPSHPACRIRTTSSRAITCSRTFRSTGPWPTTHRSIRPIGMCWTTCATWS